MKPSNLTYDRMPCLFYTLYEPVFLSESDYFEFDFLVAFVIVMDIMAGLEPCADVTWQLALFYNELTGMALHHILHVVIRDTSLPQTPHEVVTAEVAMTVGHLGHRIVLLA